jgi:hypothetical protein
MKKLFAMLLALCLVLAVFPVTAFAADKSLTLTENWQLTSDLDVNVSEGDVLTIDGQNKFYIYEMGGVLKNSGGGIVRLVNTILYPQGDTPEAGSVAATIAAATSITAVTAPAKDATSITLPTVSGYGVAIKSSSNTGVIALNGTVTPPSSQTTVTLVLTVTGNGAAADTGNISVTVPAKTDIGGGYDPGDGGNGGGGSGGGGTTTPTTPTPTPEVVTDLPAKTITSVEASEESAAKAADVVANLAETAAKAGVGITIAAQPITVSTGSNSLSVVTLSLPDGIDADEVTTMAILNVDGTLTPVPTRIDVSGDVVALISGNATLVPLNVEADFNDLRGLSSAVQDEVNRAASLMIVNGVGGGNFNPNAEVTKQQAVTMFLRAMGVPVDYTTAMTTGTAHGLTTSIAIPEAPMTRIDTATLIVNALKDLGMKPVITKTESDKLLAAFTDLGGLTSSERDAMAICVKLKIFVGYGNGRIGPGDILLRSHMASLAVRLQDVVLGTTAK